jgi:cobyrinic acid a,c-diamide synthase
MKFPISDLEKVRIGVARDHAFCFYYQDNFEVLEENGAEIVFFSPVNDRELPLKLDGIYLGGGYPELHAETLSKNVSSCEKLFLLCVKMVCLCMRSAEVLCICVKS